MGEIIINADDFGLRKSVTDAIAESFQKGYIFSTTLMVNMENAEYAVMVAKEYGIDGHMGLHLNLTQGRPLTESIRTCPLFCEQGEFHGHINRNCRLSAIEKKMVYDETIAQITRFREFGIEPDHADSHHHIHTAPFIAGPVLGAFRDESIHAVRIHRNIGKIAFYKKTVKMVYNDILKKSFWTTDYFGSLMDIQQYGIPKGTLEIMVHPDYDVQGHIVDRIGDDAEGQPLSVVISLGLGENLADYNMVRKGKQNCDYSCF